MDELSGIALNVNSKADFINFIEALIADFKTNSHNWENKSVADYFDAIRSWTEDMDGFYMNNNMPVPKDVSWNVLSHILLAAKMYE